MEGFSEGPGEHHQHQLENLFVFEITLPTPGPSTPRRASSASAGKSFCVHSPNARPINPRQGSSSTQSLDGFSEGPGEPHQHQLENLVVFEFHSPNTEPFNPPTSIISISWKTFLSSLSQHRARQPPDKHHEHQLENLFEISLPTPGPSTRGKVPVQPNHWTDLAKDPASIISISWKTFLFLSSLSQRRALQPPGEHHQHQLEKVFAFILPTPGPSTRGKVPVQPNHWTGLAKDPASIISISWKTFLVALSQLQALAKDPASINHWTDLAKDPASIISISWKSLFILSPNSRPLNPRQGSSSTQSLDGFNQGPGEHHQHQLDTGRINPPASIISISWKKFLRSLSQLQALQPAARSQFQPNH